MPTVIHPSAVVDSAAKIGADVYIGPQCIVERDVEIGDRVRLLSGVVLAAGARILEDCAISHGTVIGTLPQDLKFQGERTLIEVGPRTTVREYCTLNRATGASGTTRVGSDCLLMAYSHVAHDCQVGNRVIMANVAQMGGHVHVDDWAIIGGHVAIHQFSRIGAHTMVGAGSYISKDVPPYALVGGAPVAFSGINVVGLKRRGFSQETIDALRNFYRILYRAGLNVTDGLARIEKEIPALPEVNYAIAFIKDSQRGILRGR
jgi:UDP-N-acetylglucosamine acyltransferase